MPNALNVDDTIFVRPVLVAPPRSRPATSEPAPDLFIQKALIAAALSIGIAVGGTIGIFAMLQGTVGQDDMVRKSELRLPDAASVAALDKTRQIRFGATPIVAARSGLAPTGPR